MSHVFISYASEDHELADRARDGLERRGIRCWIAPRDIRPGDVYADAIVQAIEGADAFVLLLSDAANESDYVFRELELASASRRRVVPVLVAGVDPSRRFRFFIASSQWLRAPTAGDGGWIEALASTLAAPGPPEMTSPETDVEPVELPSADSRRPRFTQHPVRWLGAGVAVLLVLVVATVAIRWDPDDDGSDGSSGGTTTTGTTADPDDVAALRSRVPFTGCEEVDPEEPGESAELYCSAEKTGLGGAWYELYRTEGGLVDRYERLLRTYGVERGPPGGKGCSAELPAESDYDIDDRDNQGRLACFEAGDKLVFVWSRYDLLIVTVAQASGATRATLFDWWAKKAGPST